MPVRMLRSLASDSSAAFSASEIFSRSSLVWLISAVASCLSFLSLAISSVAWLRWAFRVSDLVMAARRSTIDGVKILENASGIHAALAQLFFDKR